MKKFITLLVFACALVLGSQDAQAQALKPDNSAEAIAKQKVNELNAELNLNGDQQVMLFRAFVAKDYQTNEYLKGKEVNSAEYNSTKAEVEKNFDEAVKNALTEAQYVKFKELQRKK